MDQELPKRMVERVPWMSPVHYEILAFYEERDIWISARGLSENIGYDGNYVAKECQILTYNGYLQKQGTIYSLTDMGRKFLRGEVEVKEFEIED